MNIGATKIKLQLIEGGTFLRHGAIND